MGRLERVNLPKVRFGSSARMENCLPEYMYLLLLRNWQLRIGQATFMAVYCDTHECGVECKELSIFSFLPTAPHSNIA